MAKPVKFDELNTFSLQALIDGGMRTAILPTGATEQHGAHLPLNLDYLCAQAIALGVSEQTGIPVFPALPFGHSGGHLGFPGNLSLRPETFQKVIEELSEWAYGMGFRQMIFLNGHLPNIFPLQCAVVNLLVAQPDYQLKALNWWDITPELQKQMFGDNSYGFPHGNIVETALMRYLRDDLVDMSKATSVPGQGKKLFFSYLLRNITRTGHLGDPSASTVELGEKLYRMAVDGLASQLKSARTEVPPVTEPPLVR
jgi:creatinine amidohydrolase